MLLLGYWIPAVELTFAISYRCWKEAEDLSKDEMILKLGHGKTVAAEVVGSLSLVISDHIWIKLKTVYMFVGYLKETVGYYFYDPSERKTFVSRNTLYLKKGFLADNRWDKVLLEELSEAPQQNDATIFEPSVLTNGVPVLRKSTRESQPPKRPVGCKWIYKRKLGADGQVTAFKVRLVAKGYTQRSRVDFEKTYPPIAIAKLIRILFAIAAWLDVAYALNVTSRYQTCAGEVHWSAVKTILKYLKKTKDMFLIYSGGDLILESYSDASFTMTIPSPNQVLFKLNGGVVA
ncbi:hypothetical protein Sango_2818700 [Sesamum angolense]|uniref:Reverse transcriptase Ty1/copia-type domain-containing protein n=1 Tax=Sesamum angolense TaxID=2727404 RepID=A0AAE1W0I6_9LAMI|nr:hypothetical protein Sango_2818700 [Sesamum angolense]